MTVGIWIYRARNKFRWDKWQHNLQCKEEFLLSFGNLFLVYGAHRPSLKSEFEPSILLIVWAQCHQVCGDLLVRQLLAFVICYCCSLILHTYKKLLRTDWHAQNRQGFWLATFSTTPRLRYATAAILCDSPKFIQDKNKLMFGVT